jgi:hypothetical protein
MTTDTQHFRRRMTLGRLLWTAAACALAGGIPSLSQSLSGGSFRLTGGTTAGGGHGAGGSYSLEGSAGQTATETSSGGTFQLTGGLLGVVIVPGEVTVTIETTADGQARLTWPSTAVGFQLQFSGHLGSSPNWKAVEPAPTGNVFLTPMDQPLRFFRLHKP